MEGDITVSMLGEDRYLVIATDTMHRQVASWLKTHLTRASGGGVKDQGSGLAQHKDKGLVKGKGSNQNQGKGLDQNQGEGSDKDQSASLPHPQVFLQDVTGAYAQLNLQGPRSRQLMQVGSVCSLLRIYNLSFLPSLPSCPLTFLSPLLTPSLSRPFLPTPFCGCCCCGCGCGCCSCGLLWLLLLQLLLLFLFLLLLLLLLLLGLLLLQLLLMLLLTIVVVASAIVVVASTIVVVVASVVVVIAASHQPRHEQRGFPLPRRERD